MKSISAIELENKIQASQKISILDIREDYELEFAKFSIEHTHIPMSEVMDRLNELDNTIETVVCCRTGQRAEALIDLLESKENFSNLTLLNGGIIAWGQEVDSSITPY